MKILDLWGLDKVVPEGQGRRYKLKQKAKFAKIFFRCLLVGVVIRRVISKDLSDEKELQESKGTLIFARYANHLRETSVYGVAERLESAGIKNIYVMPSSLFDMKLKDYRLKDFRNMIVPLSQFSEPHVIKLLVYEGCNLNCSGCSHFASINENPKMMSLEDLDGILYGLKRKFQYLNIIQFLGGEPLMNPNLGQLIQRTHEIFPYSRLSIITNGLLLLSVDDELLKIFRDHQVFVDITQYQPTSKRVDEIVRRLEKFHLAYNFSSEINYFRLQYNSIGNHDADTNFKNCLDWCCHTVRGNLIGGCYYAVTGDISNEVFGTDLPVEDCCYDYTSDQYTGAEILQRMNAPTKLCAYCNSFPSPIQPWHQVIGTPKAKDWFYNE